MRSLALVFSLALASCSIDFREGLQCRNDADCHGLACVSSVCVARGGDGANLGGASLVVSTIEVTGDDNGDGKLSPGETGHLRFKLKNSGSAKAVGVAGTLSTSTAGVTVDSTTPVQFGALEAGDILCGTTSGTAGSCGYSPSYYPRVEVATSVAAGTEIALRLVLSDEGGSSVALDLKLLSPAIDQDFEVIAIEVTGDNNGDGRMSPGERGNLRFKLKNTGAATALGVVGTLTTSTAGVTVDATTPIHFGELESSDIVCGTTSGTAGGCGYSAAYYPEIRIATSLAEGTEIALRLLLTDANDNTFPLDLRFVSPAINQSFVVTAIEVTGDNNGDARVSPGETGYLRFKLKNTGTATALGIVGVLSTSTAGVTVDPATPIHFGALDSSDIVCGTTSGTAGSCGYTASYHPRIRLATGVPAGTEIALRLTLTDANDNSFPLDLKLIAPPIDQAFQVTAIEVLGDNNADGTLDPGETGYLRFKLKNTGTAKALDIVGTVSLGAGATSVDSTPLHFGDLSALDIVCGTKSGTAGSCGYSAQYYLRAVVGSTVARGTTIEFTLSLVDANANRFTLNPKLTVQ